MVGKEKEKEKEKDTSFFLSPGDQIAVKRERGGAGMLVEHIFHEGEQALRRHCLCLLLLLFLFFLGENELNSNLRGRIPIWKPELYQMGIEFNSSSK